MFSISFFHLFLLCFLVLATATTEFDFGTLTLSSLKLLGDAHLNNGSVRLTRDLAVPTSGAGKVLYSKPVRFRQPSTHSITSFTTFFSFSVANLNPSSIGGGLAFVISPESETIGAAGGCLGLLNSDGLGSGFVAVEFDTLMDVEFKDINGNHVGLDLNSMVSSQTGDLDAINIDLKSGDLVNAWIEYDGTNRGLNVSVSYSNLKPNEPILLLSLDLDQYVNDFMYVGFSGSTQGSTEVHSIEWWSFSSSFDSISGSGSSSSPPPPTTSLTNPTANSGKSPPPSLAPTGSDSINSQEKNSKSSRVITSSVSRDQGRCRGGYRKCFFSHFCWCSNLGILQKGILPETGDIVAVKRCSHNSQGKNEFLSELSIIGTLRHRNLVRLQGWCHEKGKILLGVACALAYLHQECENQVIHRDVKTSNIMLDEGFNARLGDFGLARQIEHDKSPDATVAAGTMGYLAPEYLLTGRATEKTDVFSYGAVVLEVASGRRPIEKETTGVGKVGVNNNLVEWVWSLHREGRLLMAADARLEGEFDENEMRRVLLVGLACSHPDPLARPTMRTVVQMFEGEAEVPIVPRAKPTMSFSTSHLLLSLQDSVSDCNGMVTISTSSSENSYIGDDIV
ncbi:hypothetical protein GH714_027865 [Hevea brasiliensis]|uniref:non-specific serine/threonine protein kinase n=1 Tax=Hevea brasiliensis TaxID=3981 RepID=A0A6A6MHR6_HEVBR|nr:hypothetical protein GH714_027865 [Hevea brasiliensis]